MRYFLFHFWVMPFYEEKNGSFKNKKSMKRRGVVLLASRRTPRTALSKNPWCCSKPAVLLFFLLLTVRFRRTPRTASFCCSLLTVRFRRTPRTALLFCCSEKKRCLFWTTEKEEAVIFLWCCSSWRSSSWARSFFFWTTERSGSSKQRKTQQK